ncbi:hypothetical protein EYV94_23840 [Puteibacter caeruleilacunae]|nr:hypothetical protein EYV94_23840 [Puteibacter caeruleilacunae]
MRAFTSGQPIAAWLLRLSVVIVLFYRYWNTLLSFNFDSVGYIVTTIILLGAALLLIGGFSRGQGMTILSAVLLFFALLVKSYFVVPSGIENLIPLLLPLSVSVYFISHGR